MQSKLGGGGNGYVGLISTPSRHHNIKGYEFNMHHNPGSLLVFPPNYLTACV